MKSFIWRIMYGVEIIPSASTTVSLQVFPGPTAMTRSNEPPNSPSAGNSDSVSSTVSNGQSGQYLRQRQMNGPSMSR